MATDKSEPRVGLIFKIGLFAIVLLLAVRSALTSYFDEMTQAELHRKIVVAKPEALMSLRADEKNRLASGHMSIERAMHDLASRGRAAASPDIMPSASKDLAPLEGWSKMPSVVPPPMMLVPAEARDAGAASAAAGAPDAATRAVTPVAAPGGSTRGPGGSKPTDAGTQKK